MGGASESKTRQIETCLTFTDGRLHLKIICFALLLFQDSSFSRTKREVKDGDDDSENKGLLSSLFSDKRKSKTLVKMCLLFTDSFFFRLILCFVSFVSSCLLCWLQTCDDGASCVMLKCPLQGLDSNAVIALSARLWNGTFIEVGLNKFVLCRRNTV